MPMLLLGLTGACFLAVLVCLILFIIFPAKKKKRLGISIACLSCLLGSAVLFAVSFPEISNLYHTITDSFSQPPSSSSSQASQSQDSSDAALEVPTDHELVILDQDELKISILGISRENDRFVAHLNFTNNLDKDVTVQARNTQINDISVYGVLSQQVPSKQQVTASVPFLPTDPQAASIQTAETLQLSFFVFETQGGATVTQTETVRIQFQSV